MYLFIVFGYLKCILSIRKTFLITDCVKIQENNFAQITGCEIAVNTILMLKRKSTNS